MLQCSPPVLSPHLSRVWTSSGQGTDLLFLDETLASNKAIPMFVEGMEDSHFGYQYLSYFFAYTFPTVWSYPQGYHFFSKVSSSCIAKTHHQVEWQFVTIVHLNRPKPVLCWPGSFSERSKGPLRLLPGRACPLRLPMSLSWASKQSNEDNLVLGNQPWEAISSQCCAASGLMALLTFQFSPCIRHFHFLLKL